MVSELGVVRWVESSVETQTAVLGSVKRNTVSLGIIITGI